MVMLINKSLNVICVCAVSEGVLLQDFDNIVDGRTEAVVTPASAAEDSAKLLHNCVIEGASISVRKVGNSFKIYKLLLLYKSIIAYLSLPTHE